MVSVCVNVIVFAEGGCIQWSFCTLNMMFPSVLHVKVF